MPTREGYTLIDWEWYGYTGYWFWQHDKTGQLYRQRRRWFEDISQPLVRYQTGAVSWVGA